MVREHRSYHEHERLIGESDDSDRMVVLNLQVSKISSVCACVCGILDVEEEKHSYTSRSLLYREEVDEVIFDGEHAVVPEEASVAQKPANENAQTLALINACISYILYVFAEINRCSR